MPEFTIVHTLSQTVEAPTAEDAELIARRAVENSPTLYWPAVGEDHEAYQIN